MHVTKVNMGSKVDCGEGDLGYGLKVSTGILANGVRTPLDWTYRQTRRPVGLR